MISPPASQQSADSPPSAALAGLIRLARLSRLTLLYHGPDAWTDDAGRERAAAIAAAAGDDDVVVLFDAGSDMPVPDLLSSIEAAVLKAAPQAPLAPPMAGPVDALAFWQETLGLRFLLIFHRFDMALATPDTQFDQALLRLVRDPLDVSLLLVMDESGAPLLQRLRAELPDLGEAYLRMPEPAGTVAVPAPAPAEDEVAAPLSIPAELMPPPLQMPAIPDDAMAQDATVPQSQPRRSRDFSSLLEQASTAPDLTDTPAIDAAPEFAPVSPVATHALDDEKLEPWLASPAPAPAAPVVYRERLPLQIPVWMHKRCGRRRRANLAMATVVGTSSTILFIFMLMLAMLGWQMPQPDSSPAAASRAASHRPAQAAAIRGNR